MLEPYITLTEPSAPIVFGQCWWVSSWGSRLEIRIRPSLLSGTHPRINIRAPLAGRLQFVKDVLLHEMIHQHVMEHQPDVDEDTYHGHGPVFTEHCNRIGAQLGLDEVVVRNRDGGKKPKAAQWPHCVAPPDRYAGAYEQRAKKPVTARTVTIPCGYRPTSIATPIADDGDVLMDIWFDPSSGDSKPIQLTMDIDAAAELADQIIEYLTGDDDGEQPLSHDPPWNTTAKGTPQ
jgi:hypothetical protein